MSAPRVPGFTAESAIYETKNPYEGVAIRTAGVGSVTLATRGLSRRAIMKALGAGSGAVALGGVLGTPGALPAQDGGTTKPNVTMSTAYACLDSVGNPIMCSCACHPPDYHCPTSCTTP